MKSRKLPLMEHKIILNLKILQNMNFTERIILCYLITSLISFHHTTQLFRKATLPKIIIFKNNSDFMANF